MGKLKKGASEKKQRKQRSAPKTSEIHNPFEVRVNKSKHDVLGRMFKTDKGRPGLSRQRALKKRKASLLPERDRRFKSNMFLDRRIGERNEKLSADEKYAVRQAKEMSRQFGKTSKFNLGDEEDLTHHGVPIRAMGLTQDPRSEDEDEDDETGLRSDLNFGGFLKKVEGGAASMSRQDKIRELITTSKQNKFMKQKVLEETQDRTEKLDQEFSAFSQLLTSLMPQKGSKDDSKFVETKPGVEFDYDQALRELKFEPRAQASNRRKTDSEVRSEEAKRLQQLEAERIRRMEPMKIKTQPFETVDDEASSEDFTIPARSVSSSPSSPDETEPISVSKTKTVSSTPKDYDSFAELLKDASNLEMMILSLKKKPSLEKQREIPILLKYCLQFLKVMSEPASMSAVVDFVYQLAHMAQSEAAIVFLDELVETQHSLTKRPPKSGYPEIHVILLLQWISLVFPTSDYRHPVTTPASTLMLQILRDSRMSTPEDMHRALLTIAVARSFVSQSKRYIPEVLPLLANLIRMGIDDVKKRDVVALLPFRILKDIPKLVSYNVAESSLQILRVQPEQHLYHAFRLASSFLELYSYLPVIQTLAAPFRNLLKHFEGKFFSLTLKSVLDKLPKTVRPLQRERPKPKPLRLYEPVIEDSFDPANCNKQKLGEHGRLLRQYRKEFKGAVREIRKDTSFLAKVQLRETMQKDEERKAKVKRLMSDLASQEGDYNALQRKKAKK